MDGYYCLCYTCFTCLVWFGLTWAGIYNPPPRAGRLPPLAVARVPALGVAGRRRGLPAPQAPNAYLDDVLVAADHPTVTRARIRAVRMELDVYDLAAVHVILNHQRPLRAQVVQRHQAVGGSNRHVQPAVIETQRRQLLACVWGATPEGRVSVGGSATLW
jgi:hypothetical protein